MGLTPDFRKQYSGFSLEALSSTADLKRGETGNEEPRNQWNSTCASNRGSIGLGEGQKVKGAYNEDPL